MAGERFIDIVTDAEEVTQVRSIRTVVKRLANDILAKICGMSEWPYLWTEHFFQSIAPHSTGNVDITNGSKTVIGGATSPVFTSAMKGRKVRFGNTTEYYTIATFVSSTEITLDQAYTGSTDTDVEYEIYKDQYLLRADVDQQKNIRQAENGIALFSMTAGRFDELYPIATGTGVPGIDVHLGNPNKTYSTGTLAMVASTRTIDGSNTAWFSAEGVTTGTKLKIGTLIFTVKSVDDDTTITTYELATATIGAGTTYIAILDNPEILLSSIPDSVLTFFYRFQRIPEIMDADNDLPDLPYPMHPLIGLGMQPFLWRHKGMIDRAIATQSQFDKELAQWKTHYNLPVTSRKYLIQPHQMGRGIPLARWPAGTGVPLNR